MNCFKQTLLVCCLLFSSITLPETPTHNYKPSNTAIVFDIDGVILQRTIPVPSLIWQHKLEIIKAFFDFELMKTVITFVRMMAPVGAYITLFEHKRPGLVPFARDLVTTRVLDPGTVHLIENLLSLGYQLHIGTNEASNEFALHQERFPVFSRFTTYTFSDYSTFPDVTQKPMHLYFERMKDRILAHHKKTKNLIFIDDNKNNVQAARDTGYIGIDFTTPHALETSLIGLGILPSTGERNPLLTTVTL